MICPNCGNADTQKVSAVYDEGCWSEQSTSRSGFIGSLWNGPLFLGGGVTQQATLGRSRLAQRVSPPACPAVPFPSVFPLIVGIVLFFAGSWLTRHSLPYCLFLIGIPFFLVGLFAVLGGMVMATISVCRLAIGLVRHNLTQSQMPSWNTAMSEWNRQYYCRRCDVSFDPTEIVAATKIPIP